MGEPNSSPAIQLRSDCSQCAALCCIAYPSEHVPGFPVEKETGEPCPKLAQDGRCTIYEVREQAGFRGCIGYECFGAGQHVVQRLFDGRDWRSDPSLRMPMVEAFLAMRPISDLLYLIEHARADRSDPCVEDELSHVQSKLLALSTSIEGLRDGGVITEAREIVGRILRESASKRPAD